MEKIELSNQFSEKDKLLEHLMTAVNKVGFQLQQCWQMGRNDAEGPALTEMQEWLHNLIKDVESGKISEDKYEGIKKRADSIVEGAEQVKLSKQDH